MCVRVISLCASHYTVPVIALHVSVLLHEYSIVVRMCDIDARRSCHLVCVCILWRCCVSLYCADNCSLSTGSGMRAICEIAVAFLCVYCIAHRWWYMLCSLLLLRFALCLQNEWPEMLHTLLNNVTGSYADGVKSSSLEALGYMCAEVKQLFTCFIAVHVNVLCFFACLSSHINDQTVSENCMQSASDSYSFSINACGNASRKLLQSINARTSRYTSVSHTWHKTLRNNTKRYMNVTHTTVGAFWDGPSSNEPDLDVHCRWHQIRQA